MLQNQASRTEIQSILYRGRYNNWSLSDTSRILAERENRIRMHAAIAGGLMGAFLCLLISLAIWSTYQPHPSEVDKDVQKALNDTTYSIVTPSGNYSKEEYTKAYDSVPAAMKARGYTSPDTAHIQKIHDGMTKKDTLFISGGVNDTGRREDNLGKRRNGL